MSSIRTKATRAYLAVSLAVIALLLLPLSYFIEAYFRDRLVAELRTQSGVFSSFLREHARDATGRDRLVTSLGQLTASAGLRLSLVDSAGRILFESSVPESLWASMDNHRDRPEIVEARERGIGSNFRLSGTIGTRMLYVARSVDPGWFVGTPVSGLAYVRIGIESAEVDRQVADLRWLILGIGAVVMVLVVVVSREVASRITDPLVEISSIVRDIKAGHLERKLPVRGDDEVSRLAELINEMTAKLREDIEQLRKLERFRSEFLGNVSHELRTPIFSLKGFLETLSEGAIDDPAVNRSFVEKAYHHAGRLDLLLQDLIEISRIESGDMKMSFRYFDVAGFLRQVRDDFVDAAEKKNQSIRVDVKKGEITAFGDKDRLRQAMASLVENAVKYSQDGATVVLSATETAQAVTIRVSDNGPGIAEEHLPRIFERFYRVDKNRSREVGGTGLGLAIAKHIVEAHGSRISVQSAVGEGSTFLFELKR